jgi:hypothetical protein
MYWTSKADTVNMINAAMTEQDWFAEAIEMPAAPAAFSGYDFANTSNIGGYGAITSGRYETNAQRKSGFKPFGALGQGEAKERSVSLHNSEFDSEDKDTYMVFTIVNQGADQSLYRNEPDILVEVGAYPFREIDFTTPTKPTIVSADQAMYVLAGVTALAVNLLALN